MPHAQLPLSESIAVFRAVPPTSVLCPQQYFQSLHASRTVRTQIEHACDSCCHFELPICIALQQGPALAMSQVSDSS